MSYLQTFSVGHVNVIDWLVLNGGDAGISDTAGDIPLHYAAIAAKPLAILTLVDKGKCFSNFGIVTLPCYIC